MDTLLSFIRNRTVDGLLPWSVQLEASELFGMELAAIERIALEGGHLPARYQRNRQMITISQQLQLLGSRVAVVGCGGLGGYIIEQLARLGVGVIVAIDPDHFVEHNLNRQLFSSICDLGRLKVDVARERVARINPVVELIPFSMSFCSENGRELLQGCDVVVDGLDSISVRLELSAICRERTLPLVHGAIAGWYGQVATQLPENNTLENIYAGENEGRGIEKILGNPSFTPALVASLQVAEVCKLLLGQGDILQEQILRVDLLEMEFRKLDVSA